MGKIVAMIVDRKPSWRTSLRQTIAEGSSTQGIEVLECDPGIDGDEAVIRIDAVSPDVVLLDTGYPEQDGLKLCKKIVRSTPQAKVVMLTSNPAEDDDELFEVIRSGASAFLMTKYCTPQEVWETIERASRAEYPINDFVSRKPQIASLLMRQFEDIICSVRKEDGITTPLNPKEVEVLKLIVQGKTNHEIGTVLQASDSAVKKHVSNILRKLNTNDRAQAVILALRGGLVSIQPKIGVSRGQDTISDEKLEGMAESRKMVEEGGETESSIVYEAEEIARQIIDEAKQKGEDDARSVIANAEHQASQILEESKRKAEADANAIIDEGRKVAQSAAEEAAKQMIEDAKRESRDNAGLIIDAIIGEAEHQANQIIEDAKKSAQVDIDNIMEESRKAAQSAGEEMRSQARVEANTITTEAEERAKQVIEDAINKGKSEARIIIHEAHKKASRIVEEASATESEILVDAREAAEKEQKEAKKKAEGEVRRIIGEAEHQANQIIEDAKSNAQVDIDNIMEESRKAAQSASEEMRSQARVEANTITTEAEERAKQVIGDAINKGKTEASAIIVEAHKKASQIIQEAGDTKSKILAEAEEAAKQMIEDANHKAEAAVQRAIADAEHQASQMIEDANHKAEAAVQRAIADAEHQASQIIEDAKKGGNQEMSQIVAVPESCGRTITKNEKKSAIAQEIEEEGMAKLYDGIVELAVAPPVDLRTLVALHKNLKNAADIDVLNIKGSIEEGVRIRMFIRNPMPLLGVVKGISKVVAVSDDDGLTQSQEEEAVKRISVTFS